MKYGVRNQIKAKVRKVRKGQIMAQIDCDLLEATNLSSVLTADSLEDLNIKEGDQVLLMIKAIHVIPAKES